MVFEELLHLAIVVLGKAEAKDQQLLAVIGGHGIAVSKAYFVTNEGKNRVVLLSGCEDCGVQALKSRRWIVCLELRFTPTR